VAALTADDLLIGPRGRGLCTAVAHRLNQELWWASQAGDTAERDVLIRALEAVDPTPVYAWRDPLAFVEPMDWSVSNAMYWQPPHEADVVAAAPGVIAALRPVADAVATAPASAWWNTPVDLAALRYTSRFDAGHPPSPPTLTGARERLHRWRAGVIEEDHAAATDRPADPAAPFSGCWWSTPAMASLVTTTRPLPGLGSIELAWEEDSFGQRSASIWPLTTTRMPRVWEVDRPAAWVRLVDRYLLDVTNARRHDWYRTTGRVGAWRIPDWSAVADDWDAVHVTVAGYLTTATRALPLGDGDSATVLAGWNPDQTWWLTDTLATTTPHPASWHNPRDPSGPDFAWRPASR
jgi:hypothetical protein